MSNLGDYRTAARFLGYAAENEQIACGLADVAPEIADAYRTAAAEHARAAVGIVEPLLAQAPLREPPHGH